MRRMNELKREKEELMKQVGAEEDNITNNLLKKLDRVSSDHPPIIPSFRRKRLPLNRNWSMNRNVWLTAYNDKFNPFIAKSSSSLLYTITF